jgi:ubiquinone/menaquinone biosynthesis C-methylase UbiE
VTSHPNPKSRTTESRIPNPKSREGWQGWDEYAPFYDWENARTLGRRDVPFWRRLASGARGPVLELGCGTGRVSLPLARAGVELVGIDRSAPMLARAVRRARRLRIAAVQPRLPAPALRIPNPESPTPPRFVRGDIRALPFQARSFAMVMAPYGILQSLIRPGDVTAALQSVARVVEPGGTFGIDLAPDVPKWREYRNRVQLRGKARGAQLTLIESVTQDRRRRLTTFEQRYVERRGGRSREHRFDLTFHTLSVPQMARQVERAGFLVDAVLGDYRGRAWDDRADVWIILARRKRA